VKPDLMNPPAKYVGVKVHCNFIFRPDPPNRILKGFVCASPKVADQVAIPTSYSLLA
jgi:hypothetical protein